MSDWADDLDSLTRTVRDTFAEPVQVRQRAPLGEQPAVPVDVQGVFDEHHRLVSADFKGGDRSEAVFSTMVPAVWIRLADMAIRPEQGDSVVVRDRSYLVVDVQPDGSGGANLVLRRQ